MPRGMILINNEGPKGRAKSGGYFRVSNEERREYYARARKVGFTAAEARRYKDWSKRAFEGLISIRKFMAFYEQHADKSVWWDTTVRDKYEAWQKEQAECGT